MWMREPMPVTTRIISEDSGSPRSVKSALKLPEVIQLKTVWTIARDSAGIPTSWTTDATATMNDATIAPTATSPEADFDSRRPTQALIRNPRNGNRGMSSSIIAALPLQRREGVRVERLAMPEQRDHDAEADCRFGSRHSHHEEDDDLSLDGAGRASERHERKVHGIQHDLDREQDRDQVAADEHAGRPDGEQHGRENQVFVERGHQRFPPGCSSRRAISTAPTIATRMRIEVTSNWSA